MFMYILGDGLIQVKNSLVTTASNFMRMNSSQQDPVALQINLYYDELELCNPLGSRRKKHKIGILVYVCMCLHIHSH